MADFGAADLLALAKARFGERVLRGKIRGAEGEDQDAADLAADAQLLFIARTVLWRVQVAAQASVGWPLPGTWPPNSLDEAGLTIDPTTTFRSKWPYDLLEHAILLLWARVLMTGEVVSAQELKMATKAEAYFQDVEQGIPLGVGGPTDISEPDVFVARDRSGRGLFRGLADTPTVQDGFIGMGWDRVR